MTHEDPFRLALFVPIAGSAAIGLPHRFRAETGEPLDRREEGLVVLITLRLAGLLLALAALAYLIRPGWPTWAALPLPEALRWSGAVVGLLGLGLMYWTLSALGRNLTDTVVTRREHTLVTSGPYRYVRHPFYVTALLLVLVASLLSASALIGGLGLLVFVVLAVRTPTEERKLVERFGDDYRDYMRRTGWFLPRPAEKRPR